ncbi:MAG TPA: flagellar biosynthesis protein FliQ [Firmicutes bacterium]|nr:flagellar biosynthesis protein FliQ [Bacillota bacterium]
MDDVMVVSIIRHALTTILLVAGPMLGSGLLVGLLVSVFQATTQIQEQTLSFIPKIIVIFLMLAICGPWILRTLLDFTSEIFLYLEQIHRW